MRFCSNCGKEIQDGVFYCPFCGSSFSEGNFAIREKIAETRHNEIISEIGAFFGIFLIVLGVAIVPSSALSLMIVGLLFLFVGAASSLYYSLKRGKLLKKI